MDRQQATTLISNTFEHAFDEAQYLRFLRELFNGQIDESDDRKFDLYGQYIPDSFKDAVRRYKRLGTYTDPNGHEIDLMVVILKRESSLDRARTMQRNFAAYHLKRREKETAVIAYTTEDRTDWRFSMVRREPVVTFSEAGNLISKDDLTPVRRYSFLVGQNERSHTAQQQLLPILVDDKHDPSLDQLENAFNIETVTKEFFERYKSLFLQLKEALDGLTTQDERIHAEFAQKGLETANFAKKLLGQIVFLYFLQKKGWMGVALDGTWGTGSKTFLRDLFNAKGSYRNFFNDMLEPLFYEALAIERPDNIYPRLNAKIPFLNGGLFEPVGNYDWRSIDILIDNSVFESIFTTFDLYNFTVREDEPLEKEVAVDPEMLGKVFENLLEVTDRKSKGAFYTPREIVHYMCQESLINYLDTKLNSGSEPLIPPQARQQSFVDDPEPEQLSLTVSPATPVIPRDDIASFIRVGELAVQNDTAKEAGTVSYKYRMPETIRSNAAKLDEALATIKICDPAIGSGAFPVGMMQEIIKAREVLTTYLGSSDERTTYHFKRQAIQDSIYGVDIDPGAVDVAKLRLWLSLVVDEDDYHHIKPLPNLDYKIVCGNSLLSYPYQRQGLEAFEALKRRFFDETNPRRKNELRNEIERTLNQIFADTVKSLGYRVTVDFRINFSEVFRENGGFDVVIANPPYVRQERIKEYKDALEQLYANVYAGTADLFVYFYAQGFNILKKQGVLTFITPNKFMRANYGKKLRSFLANKTRLQTLIDFGDLPVFDATTYPMITIARNQLPNDNTIKVLEIKSLDAINSLHQVVDSAYPLPQETLSGDGWQLSAPEIRALIDKLKAAGKPLGEYVNGMIYRGVVTGLNEAFVIDEAKRLELIASDPKSVDIIKPYLRGRDIKRWQTHWTRLYIIFTRRGINIDEYPAIKAHLVKWKEDLTPKKSANDKHGRKPGRYKWYEIQDDIAYYAAFEKPKIIYSDIAQRPQFVFDDQSFFAGNTCYFVPSGDHFLSGILNSRSIEYFYGSLSPQIQGGYYRFFSQYVLQLPIPNVSTDIYEKISLLARRCMDTAKSEPQALPALEAELNQLVYQAYKLNADDIALIERELEISSVQQAADFLDTLSAITGDVE